MPYQVSGVDMFPGFSIVNSFEKAFVGADENGTSGTLKSDAYSGPVINFEYRRPYIRSVCFLQICTPVRYTGLNGVDAIIFTRYNLFGPKRSCGIWGIVIKSVFSP